MHRLRSQCEEGRNLIGYKGHVRASRGAAGAAKKKKAENKVGASKDFKKEKADVRAWGFKKKDDVHLRKDKVHSRKARVSRRAAKRGNQKSDALCTSQSPEATRTERRKTKRRQNK